MAALKNYLQLVPGCFSGTYIMFNIYHSYGCKYQACQTVFNWLQNNPLYKHLIPPDFTMDHKDTVDLNE